MPVTKMEIASRQAFAGGRSFGDVGPYEQLDGTVHFAVDPANNANETVTDIGLARETLTAWWSFLRISDSCGPSTRPAGMDGWCLMS